MKKYLITCLLLGLLLTLLSACGGGGGGGRTPTIPNPGGSNNNQQPPVTFEPAEVTVPLIAESGGEIGGIVADFEGTPVPDIEVTFDSSTSIASTTDNGGNFLAAGVSSGDHTISIGMEGIQVASFGVTYDESMPMNVALSPAGLRTTSAETEFGKLQGHVTSHDGAALPGVHILLFNNEQFFMLRETNAEGFYDFAEIPVGSYSLLGYKRGYRTHVATVNIFANETTVHDFVMEGMPIGRVIGVVRNEDEQPIPRTHVFLLYRDHEEGREPPAFHTLTNESGEYAFSDVPAGVADMLAYHPEYEPADAEVNVPPEGQVVQNFILHRTAPPPPPPPDYGTLVGRVFDRENNPISGALIVLERENLRFTAESNEYGYYQFGELPVGPYHFVVSADGYQPVDGQLAILPGQNWKNFFLCKLPPPGGVIEGTVFWGDSQDFVVGAHVEVWVPGGDGTMHKIRDGESGERGQFRFAEIPVGPGVVKAYKENAQGATEYVMQENGAVTMEVRIFPQEQWTGKICGLTKRLPDDPNGNYILVPCAEVKLFRGEPGPDNPPIAVTQSNADAYYEFINLPPTGDGPFYWLVARKVLDDGTVLEGVTHTPLGENQVVELHIIMGPPAPPPPTSKIHGKVFIGGTDPPQGVMGACVRLFHGEPGPNNPPIRSTSSGDGGYYAFPELPPSGDRNYFILATKLIEGVEYSGLVNTALGENEIKIIDVPIFPSNPPPNGVLYGLVQRYDPEHPDQLIPVPGATVKIYHNGQGPLFTVTTGPDGWYEIPNIPPSGDVPYGIVADKWINEVHYIGDASANVPPGGEVRKDVIITAQEPPPTLGSISGLTRRENPEDPSLPPIIVPCAYVELFLGEPQGQQPIATTYSNADGYYIFSNLEPTGDVPYYVVAHKLIEEVQYQGMAHTYLQQGQNVELHIMMYPPV